MELLGSRTLDKLSACVTLPRYDFKRTRVGIVHIGPGAFHRAHQALYTHEVMNQKANATLKPGRWGIFAASLFSEKGLVTDLPEQDGLYNVLEMTPDGKENIKLCAAIRKTCMARHNRAPLIEAMASPDVCVVSLTITEKGYCVTPSGGQLIDDNPLIVHDMENPTHPKSVPGLIIAALALRKKRGLQPFSVMSCDNCAENGKRTRSAVVQLARRRDTGFAQWIEDHVGFPSTMVDRIVPASTEKAMNALCKKTGLEDKCGIVCESFRQWIIEDDFPLGRPEWESLEGVLMVKDVNPYECMKLRMLNGAHSLLAYLGYLGGYRTICQTMQNPEFEKLIAYFLLEEAIPGLTPPEGLSLEQYAKALIARFKNPYIEHSTWQIAMDGSQKIPQRWLETVKALITLGKNFNVIALGIAAWMHYVSGVDEQGKPVDVRDPLVDLLHQAGKVSVKNPQKSVGNFLAIQAIFPTELSQHHVFKQQVSNAFVQIKKEGVKKTVSTFIATRYKTTPYK